MSTVEIQQEGAVAWIWLNRPERLNAINRELGSELVEALSGVGVDPSVRAVVLAGRGRAFCAGDDLSSTRAEEGFQTHASRRQRYIRGEGRWPVAAKLLTEIPKPVIARLHGHAHGAGWDLALSCDFRIASESLSASHAYVRRGLASGTARLTSYVGRGVASELLMTGRTLTAREAHSLGLVTRVVPDEELEVATKDFAAELSSGPTSIIALLKSALGQSYPPSFDERMRLQADVASDSANTQDSVEGRAAFREKRPPRFPGA